MKKMLIMCGTGVATSTVVMGKMKEWLCDRNLGDKVKLYQSSVSEGLGRLDDYDIIVSTTIVPISAQGKVIDGIPFLTGIGTDNLYNEIFQKIIEG